MANWTLKFCPHYDAVKYLRSYTVFIVAAATCHALIVNLNFVRYLWLQLEWLHHFLCSSEEFSENIQVLVTRVSHVFSGGPHHVDQFLVISLSRVHLTAQQWIESHILYSLLPAHTPTCLLTRLRVALDLSIQRHHNSW